MQARAGAIDELLASGALDDVSGTPRDDIQAELDRVGAGSSVELELARLKGELGQGEAPKEIGGAGPASQMDGQRPATGAQQPAAEDGA
jgi:phage shock protein A